MLILREILPKPRGMFPSWPEGQPRVRRIRYTTIKKGTPKKIGMSRNPR